MWTARVVVREVLYALVFGLVVAYGLPAIAQDVAPPDVPDATVSGFVDAMLAVITTDPSTMFLLKSTAVVLMIGGMTAGVQAKFKRLQEDTDLTKLMVMGVALGLGLFFGIVGVAPDAPKFTGRIATLIGGLTCGAIAMTGASFLSRAKSAYDEIRSAKASSPAPPPAA